MTNTNLIQITKAIFSVLHKSQGKSKKQMPKITVMVFYEEYHECIFSESELNEKQRLLCLNLLVKMLPKQSLTSQNVDDTGADVGAIRWQDMIIAIAGINAMKCKITIVKALILLNKISEHEIKEIEKDLNIGNIHEA